MLLFQPQKFNFEKQGINSILLQAGNWLHRDEDLIMDASNKTTVDLNCEQGGLSCKLTMAGLQQRKATVIAGLKEQSTGRKELSNGYAFRFNNSDKMLDMLLEFIKTERACCDFFTFRLSVDKTETWLELTGPEGAKNFIVTEMEL